MRKFLNGTVALAALLAGAGCSGTDSSPVEGMGRVALRLSTAPSGGSAISELNADVTVSQGGNVLVITDVQLVARKIKLEQKDGSCPTPVLNTADGANSDTDSDDTDECPNLKLGPVLLDPPLTAGVETTFSVDLPAGTYDELELQIHKPTANPADVAFVAANPTFAGVSIKVTGTYNGVPFTFTTDLTAEIEMELPTPVVVTVGGATSLTMRLEVGGWFRDQGGVNLINPASLTQQLRQRIEQNIRASFRAFRDQNQDGRED